MVASRWTAHPTVVPDCPVCGEPLPPVVIDVDARGDGGQVTSLEVSAQPLDGAWWNAAEQLHPSCGVRLAQARYRAGRADLS